MNDGNIKVKNALSVGCGMGSGMYKVARLMDFPIYGIDISTVLREKWWRVSDKLRFANADMLNIPFKERSFDLVACVDVLEHLEEKYLKKALEEILRVGKELWMIVVCTVAENIRYAGYGQLHLTVKNHQWWADLIQDCGFGIRDYSASNHHLNLICVRAGSPGWTEYVAMDTSKPNWDFKHERTDVPDGDVRSQ